MCIVACGRRWGGGINGRHTIIIVLHRGAGTWVKLNVLEIVHRRAVVVVSIGARCRRIVVTSKRRRHLRLTRRASYETWAFRLYEIEMWRDGELVCYWIKTDVAGLVGCAPEKDYARALVVDLRHGVDILQVSQASKHLDLPNGWLPACEQLPPSDPLIVPFHGLGLGLGLPPFDWYE